MNKLSGFSLVEILLALALASSLLILISNSNFNLYQSKNIKSASIELEQSANIVFNYLHRKIAATELTLSGENAIPPLKNDSLSYGFSDMLDCAGNGTKTRVDYETIKIHKDNLRCDANGPEPPYAQPMLDNVASLQFLYGIDSNNDDSINRYLTADKIIDWSKVKSVMVGILLRSEIKVFSAKQFREHQVLDFSFKTNDRYHYRAFTLNIALRNRFPVITRPP